MCWLLLASAFRVLSGSASPVPPACANLTFELVPADEEKSINYTEQVSTSSHKQCIELCYIQNCAAAGFLPPSSGDSGTCLLAYNSEAKCDEPGSTRVSDLANVTGIRCIKCGMWHLEFSFCRASLRWGMLQVHRMLWQTIACFLLMSYWLTATETILTYLSHPRTA